MKSPRRTTRQVGFSDLLFVSEFKRAELKRYVVRTPELLFARQRATTGGNALTNEQAAGCLINYQIISVALDHTSDVDENGGEFRDLNLCSAVIIDPRISGCLLSETVFVMQAAEDRHRGYSVASRQSMTG